MKTHHEDLLDVFRLFDADKSGTIDANELKQIMSSCGVDPSPEELKEYVAHADTDGDGQISFEEFEEMMKKCRDAQGEEQIELAFSFFDLTDDNIITPEELRRAMENLGSACSLKDAEIMCTAASDQVDARGRPTVSLKQLKAYMAK